MINGYIITA